MSTITFTEVMRGPFAGDETDPQAGAAKGTAIASILTMRVTVHILDLDVFLKDPNHIGELSGEVKFFGWPEAGKTSIAKVAQGTVHLFRPASTPGSRLMEYLLDLTLDGKTFFLQGRKHIRDDFGPDLLADTTTLETTVHEGNKSGPVVAAGVLQIGFQEQLGLLRSLRASGAPLAALNAKTRFFRFFVGQLWQDYISRPGNGKSGMVCWYTPTLFLRAGVEVLVSSMFAQYADQRLLQAALGRPQVFDYSRQERTSTPINDSTGIHNLSNRSEAAPSTASVMPQSPARNGIWIDFVADTGDGWDSTYSIASLVTRPELAVAADGEDGKGAHRFQEGDILVFGGDQVYPSASRADYQNRLVDPYRTAFGMRAPAGYPDVFAIPGNHDWYDGLLSFSRLFCSQEPFAGGTSTLARSTMQGCETPQRHSYFALKLSHGWWLLGADVQLRSDIDGPQLDYFRAVAKLMEKGDRIILCVAEPHWLYPKRAERGVETQEDTALDVLEREVLGERVRVFLAGDVHHYKRYESGEGRQKITAGGGGAFLHPTHGPWPDELQDKTKTGAPATTAAVYTHRKSFPSKGTSWCLGLRNLLFPFLNPKFGILTGVLYLIMALMIMPAMLRLGAERRKESPQKDKVEPTESPTLPPSPKEENRSKRIEPVSGGKTRSRSLDALLADYERYLKPRTFVDQVQSLSKMEEIASKLKSLESKGAATVPRTAKESKRKEQEIKKKVQEKFKNEEVAPEEDPETSLKDDKASAQIVRSWSRTGFWVIFADVLKNESKLNQPFETMLFAFFALLVLFGFYYFTDIPERLWRAVFGIAHAVLHYLAAFFLVYCVWFVPFPLLRGATAEPQVEPVDAYILLYAGNWILLAIAFVGGYLLGPLIMGIYLFGALNLCNRHWNEAFSSLRIRDWKNFLRLHIGPDGRLTIYPIGLRKVPRKWKDNPDADGPLVLPDGTELKPILIEPPIIVDKGAGNGKMGP